jgi:hypothetical protein
VDAGGGGRGEGAEEEEEEEGTEDLIELLMVKKGRVCLL